MRSGRIHWLCLVQVDMPKKRCEQRDPQIICLTLQYRVQDNKEAQTRHGTNTGLSRVNAVWVWLLPRMWSYRPTGQKREREWGRRIRGTVLGLYYRKTVINVNSLISGMTFHQHVTVLTEFDSRDQRLRAILVVGSR